MNLPGNLLDEFAKVTHDQQEKKESTLFYGTARFTSDGDFVMIDGATTPTPASYATSAVEGDRVMGTIKNHKAIITANITNPSMTLGILRAISGIIVEGYLTTNAERTRYDDQTRTGLTFSNGGMGAYGGQGKYWYITNTGDFRAEQAYVKGTISASSGFIGSETSGFKIDEYGIYSGATKTGTSSGYITLGNTDFTRAIGGTDRTLRFAIGSSFGVTATGVLYASNIDITGKITATSGKIGNFDINGALYSNNKSTLSSNVAGVYLGTDGIALGQDGKFKVTSAGVLTATGATITGTLTAGANSKIGPWTVSTTSIYKGNNNYNNASSLYFGDSGLSIKQNFLVDSNGYLTAKEGNIAGWTIKGTYLEKYTASATSANDAQYRAYIQAPETPTNTNAVFALAKRTYNGSSYGSWSYPFIVRYDGSMTATNANITGTITAEEGKIGGFDIGSVQLRSDKTVNNIQYSAIMQSVGSATDMSRIAFCVAKKENGTTKYPFLVRYNGNMVATGGSIGGWTIESEVLHKVTDDGNYRIRLQAPASATSSNYAIRVDKKENGDWVNKIALGYSGAFYAASANITGTVHASSGSIGPWTLNSTSLYTGSSQIGGSGVYFGNNGISISSNFIVSSDGKLKLTGTNGSSTSGFGTASVDIKNSTTQHTQIGADYLYTGDNSASRVALRPNGLYGQLQSYQTFAYSSSYQMCSLIAKASGGKVALLGVKGWDDTFRVPVGSSSTAGNKCYGLGARSGNVLYVSGEWGTAGASSTCHATFSASSSDIRLKENIQKCDIQALPLINSIQIRSFDWTDNRDYKHQPIGMVADEIEKLDPRLAYGGGYEEDGSMIVKSVDTFYLVGYLVKAVQELSDEVTRLRSMVGY